MLKNGTEIPNCPTMWLRPCVNYPTTGMRYTRLVDTSSWPLCSPICVVRFLSAAGRWCTAPRCRAPAGEFSTGSPTGSGQVSSWATPASPRKLVDWSCTIPQWSSRCVPAHPPPILHENGRRCSARRRKIVSFVAHLPRSITFSHMTVIILGRAHPPLKNFLNPRSRFTTQVCPPPKKVGWIHP